MADASGTPTSPDNIPTYATAADAPSGKGFNTAMAAIQTALSKRLNVTSLFTSVGDLAYASGAGVAARLGIGSSGQVLTVAGGVPTWAAAPGAGVYRKTTAKTVNTSVAKTDLLNGEVTVAANAIGASGMLRLTAWGDFLQNTGGVAAIPTWELMLGSTALIAMNTSGAAYVAGASRQGWRIVCEVMNLGAANAQMSSLAINLSANNGAGTVNSNFSPGEGYWSALSTSAGNNLLIVGHGMNPSTAVDTSLAQALKLNVTNGANSALYETKLYGAVVEIL